MTYMAEGPNACDVGCCVAGCDPDDFDPYNHYPNTRGVGVTRQPIFTIKKDPWDIHDLYWHERRPAYIHFDYDAQNIQADGFEPLYL